MGCFKMKQKCEPKKKLPVRPYFLRNALLGIHSGSNEGCIGIYGFALICFSFDLDLPGL